MARQKPWHWVTYSSGWAFGCHCAIGRDHTGAEDLELEPDARASGRGLVGAQPDKVSQGSALGAPETREETEA